MKRIEIYINSKGNLTIDLFKRYEDEYVHSTYTGNNAYELIRKLASNKPNDIVENRIRDNISLEYRDYIVILNEPHILLKRKGLGPLIKNIDKFYEEGNKTIVKNKKVSRKNNHTGQKVIAVGLTSLMLFAVAYGLNQNKGLDNIETNITIFQEQQSIDNKSEFVIETEEEQLIKSIFVDYGDRSSTEKAYITKAYYGGLIEKYAKQYGLDPALVLGIATQERGVHSEKKDFGGATGLMQIQNSVWEEEYIAAYNYETQKTETMYVTKNKIQNINDNIRIGCMYLQNCMKYMDYNVTAAVQCYNMGYGNVMKVLDVYAKTTNKTVKDILKDITDTGWLEYRKIIDVGDQKYVEHVFSWMGSDLNIENRKTNNSSVKVNVVNQIQAKNISLK